MSLSEECKGDLLNWKFSSAAYRLSEVEPTEEERAAVEALAQVFGNPGWFSGAMGVIVGAVVNQLVVSSPHEGKDPGQ